MELFSSWWSSLGTLGQIFATAAIPATVIMLLQTVLLLVGFAGHDTECDHEMGECTTDLSDETDEVHDGAHHMDGLRLFTVRGIVAMFAIGGWTGVALCDAGFGPLISGGLAMVAGLAALFLAAYVIKLSLKLQDDGNFNIKNAVAHTATVYIPIPPSRGGTGKITMNLQERFVELDAMTDHGEKLPTGAMVQVVSVTDKNEVIVRPMK